MSRIHVTIDRLVLPGIAPGERQALVEALRSELARVLLQGGQARARRTPVLRLGRLPMLAGIAGSRKFGVGLARAIGKGLQP